MSSKVIDERVRLFRAPQRQPSALFFVYVVLFHGGWIAWPYLVYPRLVSIGEHSLSYALIHIGLRLLIWVVPVFAYLRSVERVEPLGYLRLTRHVGRGVTIGLFVTALNVAGSIARFGLPHPSMARITWNSMLGTSFFVGFIEEIPYRGFMLQQIESRSRFWTANLLSSVLFVGIHLPGWIALHQLSTDRVVTIFVFGVVMAVVFKYSGSLWAAIVAHSANDFLSFVLFGR
jgi:membrane protease YdiL (CAAX protease family)